jgi:hypothetical protein
VHLSETDTHVWGVGAATLRGGTSVLMRAAFFLEATTALALIL